MRLLSLLVVVLALLTACASGGDSASDDGFVVHNAVVYTVDEDVPRAEAFAVRNGRLLTVGSAAEVLDAHPNLRRVDAGGRTIVPGIIDAHAHIMNLGRSLLQAPLTDTPSKAAIVDTLTAFAETLPAGAWLQGRGWDQNDWPSTGFPTRQDLDTAFPERPVFLERIDGHASWANTAAIEATIGLDSLTAMDDPEGGAILRNADGVPTGVFIDAAAAIVGDRIPAPSEAELSKALEAALAETARYGLTGVHDAGVNRATVARYRRFIQDDRFPLRVHAMIGGRGATFDHFCERGALPPDSTDGRLQVNSVKLYVDGALGSRGAALLNPYSDDPDNRGLLMKQPRVLEQDVKDALACGFQVNTHAIGDRANRVTLDAYEAAMQIEDDGPGRHRVEHAQILHPDDLSRFAELDVIASMQPTHATSDMDWADERLGEDRLDGAYAWDTLHESGARLAFGSDFPVEDVDPIEGIYSAVTRQHPDGTPPGGWTPEERLSRDAALKAFTLDAAYASFQEDDLGSLTPGKRADFVVLSQNLMTVPVDEILATEVVATYLDGEAVYSVDAWME